MSQSAEMPNYCGAFVLSTKCPFGVMFAQTLSFTMVWGMAICPIFMFQPTGRTFLEVLFDSVCDQGSKMSTFVLQHHGHHKHQLE